MGDVVKSELDVCDKGYCDGGEDYGHKGDAAEAGDESFVDLAFVEDGNIWDYYPYWHNWISFTLEAGVSATTPKQYEDLL